MSSTIRVYDSGTSGVLTPQEAAGYPVIVSGAPGAEGALAFESDDAFWHWGAGTRFATQLEQHHRRLDHVRGLDEAGRSDYVSRLEEVEQSIQSQLQRLAKTLKVPLDSQELLQEAVKDPEIRGLTTDPITLYEHRGRSGRSVALWGDTPDLSRVDFNDIASSARQFLSFGTLFGHIWFQGRKHVMFAVLVYDVDLDAVAFDDIASSYLQAAAL